MDNGVSESCFYMWRAIFAMAHADGVVTEEETEFLQEYLSNVSFSDEQLATLKNDLKKPGDVGEMFSRITDHSDRAEFFYFARMLSWCDGDFDEQEKVILEKLRNSHISSLNLENISRSVRHSAELVAAALGKNGVSMNFWENLHRLDKKEDGKE